MDQPTLQSILLAIIAAEGAVVVYALMSASGTTGGGSGTGHPRPGKGFQIIPPPDDKQDPNNKS